jgi:hypothetical protein
VRMAQRAAEPREIVREIGRDAFAFLLGADFLGPEVTEDGLIYHRPGLQVEVRYLGPYEPEVATTVRRRESSGVSRSAGLACLYAAFGAGQAEDVPVSADTLEEVATRVNAQAAVLRAVLPEVLGPDLEDAIRRCQGRSTPRLD